MTIDVTRLAEGGERFAGSAPAAVLEWDPADELLQPTAAVDYHVRAELLDSALLVRGRLGTRFGGVCSRCGGALDIAVRDDDFCVSIPVAADTPQVDLTPTMRESILLALPSHPVCRPDCAGLCPRCGSALANGACACPAPAARGWEGLAGLAVPPDAVP